MPYFFSIQFKIYVDVIICPVSISVGIETRGLSGHQNRQGWDLQYQLCPSKNAVAFPDKANISYLLIPSWRDSPDISIKIVITRPHQICAIALPMVTRSILFQSLPSTAWCDSYFKPLIFILYHKRLKLLVALVPQIKSKWHQAC